VKCFVLSLVVVDLFLEYAKPIYPDNPLQKYMDFDHFLGLTMQLELFENYLSVWEMTIGILEKETGVFVLTQNYHDIIYRTLLQTTQAILSLALLSSFLHQLKALLMNCIFLTVFFCNLQKEIYIFPLKIGKVILYTIELMRFLIFCALSILEKLSKARPQALIGVFLQGMGQHKHNLLRLGRKLKEIDEDVQRHNELLEVVKSTPSDKLGSIVAKRRKDFTVEFFNHLYYVAESCHDEPEKQTELAKLGNDCVDALQAHDDTTGSLEALNAAELKLKDILNSPSVDAACRKIDDLAEKKELDSALVLMLSKAWSAAKGTDITKSEAKDIMFHLYMTAVANLQRQMPKDIRILKHLIMIEDPEERSSALNDAFTPGPELQGDNVDTLYT
ncbi:hypothetical protein ACJX0J_022402, partial [Zea mays]